MSIRFRDVELLAPLLAQLGDSSSRKLLTLGVQDCNFTLEQVIKFLEWKRIKIRALEQSEVLPTTGLKWKTGKEKNPGVIHQKTFFALLGFRIPNVQSLDVSDYEGADHIHDLNYPLPQNLYGQFDFVFDGGVVEHVFSIKDALFNAAQLVRVGGIVAHHSPFDWPQHGYININPKLYRTFYLNNGFEEVDVKLVAEVAHDPAHYLIVQNPTFTISMRPQFRSSIFVAYRKIKEVPMQIPLEPTYQELTGRQFSARTQ
jgi:hypothetical protein